MEIDRAGVVETIAKLDVDIQGAFASWQRLMGAKIAYQRMLAEIDGEEPSKNGKAVLPMPEPREIERLPARARKKKH
jgi:hypothetical protein